MSQGKSLLSHQNENPIEKKKSNLSGFGKFIWNSSKREFCGRDGASWAKISLFYVVFYSLLGLFFIGLLAVFAAVMPLDKPTYYGEESVMNQAILNPGLGFRPQIDVEDNFIHYNPNIYEKSNKGFKQYVENLNHFLESKYKQSEDSSKVIQCIDGNDYTQDLMSGKYCDFDFKKIFQETNCTKENNFGYETNNLCVLIKLNKIYSWKPTFNANEEKKIKIKCEGEYSSDIDNIRHISYHSENNLNNPEHGYLDAKYYPFNSQSNYKAPLVMVQFDLKPNTLVNVICKAYAENIDNMDRRNQRGMTKFSIFVENKKHN